MADSGKSSIFISYRRADSPDTVKLIHERLHRDLPQWEVFYDHRSIPPGEPFPELLRDKVTSADVVLVIVGPSWTNILQQRKDGPGIDHVREEIRLALEAGNLVIPVTVENSRLPKEEELAGFEDIASLRTRNALAVRPDPDFDTDLRRVVTEISRIGPPEGVGSVLDGKYKILREIGAGGMGVVYAAEQRAPRRTVAIKLIKPGMDSREILARFDAERQALSVMDHPNIAKVLDAGSGVSGRPYFVMEHVRGIPITDYCDQQRLSPTDRLKLFKLVCGAVQHAHQKGIIHRDIKPANVLVETVEGRGVPKVIDFGLAKALGYKLTDKTLMTSFETRLGTLEYASPEQSAGKVLDVDTRTDIYSLGALLYELLAGAPPFSRADLLAAGEVEMRRVILESDPPRPSVKLSSSNSLPAIAANRRSVPEKLTGLVRGDLDWIVMKALEKDPRRRYETASSLSGDIDRYLANEPIEARPPGSAYIMSKFIRRHRGAVISASIILFVLVAGLIGSGLGWNRALQEQERAKQSEARALENEALAREQSELALKSLESVIVDIQSKLKNFAGGAELRRKLLQTALERLNEVSSKYASRSAIDRGTMLAQVDLADVFLRIGSDSQFASEKSGPLESAHQLYQKAFETANKLIAQEPENMILQRDLSNICDKLGDVQTRLGNLTEALQFYQRGLGIRETLAAAQPDNADAARILFISWENIGETQLSFGQLAAAKESYRRSREITEKIAAANPNDPQAKRDLAFAYGCLARVQQQSGELKEAIATTLKEIEINKSLVLIDPNDARDLRNLAVGYAVLGRAHGQSGNTVESLSAHQEAFEINKLLAAKDPSDFLTQRDLGYSLMAIGNIQIRLGALPQARAALQEALEISRTLALNNPADVAAQRDLADAYYQMSGLHRMAGELNEAIEMGQSALKIRITLSRKDPGNTFTKKELDSSYSQVGEIQLALSRSSEAQESFHEALEIQLELAKVDPADVEVQRRLVNSYKYIGYLQQQSGDLSAALISFQKGLEIQQVLASRAPEDLQAQRDLLQSWQVVAESQVATGNFAEALNSHQKCLEIAQALAASHPNDVDLQRAVWVSHCGLGAASRGAKKFAEAIGWYEKARTLLETALDQGQLAEDDREFLDKLDSFIDSCQQMETAFGEWTKVLEQPAKSLPELLEMRAIQFVKTDRIPEAIQAVEKLLELGTATPEQLYNSACVFSLAANSISNNADEGAASDSELQKQYSAKALSTLREAIEAGWKNFEYMKNDPDLAPLRDLPDFQKLLRAGDKL